MLHLPHGYIYQQYSFADGDSVTFGPLEETKMLKGISSQYVTVRGCHSWTRQIAPNVTACAFPHKGINKLFVPRASPALCSSLLSWSRHLLTIVWKALSRSYELERVRKSKRQFAQKFLLTIRQMWSFLITVVMYLRRHVRNTVLRGFLLFLSVLGYLTATKDSNTACTHPISLLSQNYHVSINAFLPLPSVLHWCLSFPNLLFSTACATASFSCCSDT